MKDLFEKEQNILEHASVHLEDVKNGLPCDSQEFAVLVKEYGRVLKQLRRITRMSDRTTVNLNSSKLALLDKVHYDALTGIYNRRYMEENLNTVIKTLARSGGATLSVLMMDVDFFKKYNDTYGHSMGDECLKIVATALKSTMARAGDFVARYGGEEFAAILPNTDEHGARIMAERILESVRACGVPHSKSSVADCVTISIGATSGYIWNSQSGEDFIRKADEALYLSKQNGRNRYTYLNFEGITE
ncbi:hypothetical protein C4J81_03590 [Deltaproteobacteria bacterium Smac51]|nr:hypothetical protein C4J81_03590 [Deltaproteobacteria bacterium Smac51]